MKLALALVALAALCFFAGAGIVSSGNAGGARQMTTTDMLIVASVGFLILAGARVLFVTLARTR
jgi:hypothetical protein